MKFHPILFSTEMVSAILRGDKTMTRRVMKIQPDNEAYFEVKYVNEGVLFDYNGGIEGCQVVRSPYGNVGDVLWVREKFCPTGSEEYLNAETNKPFFYAADVKDIEIVKEFMPNYGWKWKPSIHMPKAACRIFLEITNIRVERLHDISEQDAKSEGIDRLHTAHWWKNYLNSPLPGTTDCIHSFQTLWQSINGPESWKENPWVWVIEFKQIEKPSNFC